VELYSLSFHIFYHARERGPEIRTAYGVIFGKAYPFTVLILSWMDSGYF